MSTATGANENSMIANAIVTERPLRAYARSAVKPIGVNVIDRQLCLYTSH